jgi:hypothetical protein
VGHLQVDCEKIPVDYFNNSVKGDRLPKVFLEKFAKKCYKRPKCKGNKKFVTSNPTSPSPTTCCTTNPQQIEQVEFELKAPRVSTATGTKYT